MAVGTEMGEFMVGAYLNVVEGCNFVDYNVHPPGGGLKGLEELDVVGLNFDSKVAYLCEVTTHIRSLLYKDRQTTIKRVRDKFQRQRAYASDWLAFMEKHKYMFWSPVVSKGLASELSQIDGLELVINQEYSRRVTQLREVAKRTTHNTGNPAFRILQILEHLKQ